MDIYIYIYIELAFLITYFFSGSRMLQLLYSSCFGLAMCHWFLSIVFASGLDIALVVYIFDIFSL